MSKDSKQNEVSMVPLFIVSALIILFGVLLISFSVDSKDKVKKEISFPTFIELVKTNKIKTMTIQGNVSTGSRLDEKGALINFETVGDFKSPVYQQILLENKIIPSYKEESDWGWFWFLLINAGLLIIFFWMIGKKQGRGGVGSSFDQNSFDKATSDSNTDCSSQVRFADVAGVDEAKEELNELVEFLKKPEKFTSVGGRLPKGALLVGPPGTGKTLLAKAVAGEAGVPFFAISGSNFVELYVGVGASRVRKLFEKAKAKAPCIIFIDEIDAVGRQRTASGSGGNDERESTLNQLLVEMDGFSANLGIIILAATNRDDILDSALLRPGRFDRRVYVPLPDVKGRAQIIETHIRIRGIQCSKDVDTLTLAKNSVGFSGAELETLVNEAAIYAARKEKNEVGMEEFEQAQDKIIMGVERKSMFVGDEEKRSTAYHEAGHALISKLIKGLDTVHKVSIIPRGQALGVTLTMPEQDRLTLSKEKAENMIKMLMGGRAAEDIIYGHFTTGASNDIEKATNIAKQMVCRWGMSSKLGPIQISEDKPINFQVISPRTLELVDEEIRSIVQSNYEEAKNVLTKNIELLHKVTALLLEKENISGEEIDQIIDNLSR